MVKKKIRSSRAHWLLPVVYALPILAAAGFAWIVWGSKIRDLISIVVKVAVIS